jgi:hypothetical protein
VPVIVVVEVAQGFEVVEQSVRQVFVLAMSKQIELSGQVAVWRGTLQAAKKSRNEIECSSGP